MLGSPPKQMVGGMERVSRISQAFPGQGKGIGGCGPQFVVCCPMFMVFTKDFFAASTTKPAILCISNWACSTAGAWGLL